MRQGALSLAVGLPMVRQLPVVPLVLLALVSALLVAPPLLPLADVPVLGVPVLPAWLVVLVRVVVLALMALGAGKGQALVQVMVLRLLGEHCLVGALVPGPAQGR